LGQCTDSNERSQQATVDGEVRSAQISLVWALGLVVNIIILWNTLYINAALEQLASEGFAIQTEDIARLSPLVFEHINLLGRYAFSVVPRQNRN
jgi:hypothetical protein